MTGPESDPGRSNTGLSLLRERDLRPFLASRFCSGIALFAVALASSFENRWHAAR